MKPLTSFLLPFLASFLLLTLIYTPAADAKRPPHVVPCAIIPTSEGVRLSGHIFGGGEDAVILAHMYPDDQTQWYGFALSLSERGYQVLTFDFHGFGESEGSINVSTNHRDIRSAVSYLQARGARNIYLVGASMGGTASLRAIAGRRIPGVRAVVTLSSPVEILGLNVKSVMRELRTPALFLAAEDDGAAPGNARWFYENTAGLRQLRVWPGYDHGTDLLRGPYAWEVQQEILEFLERNRPAPPDQPVLLAPDADSTPSPAPSSIQSLPPPISPNE